MTTCGKNFSFIKGEIDGQGTRHTGLNDTRAKRLRMRKVSIFNN